ncbi:MAG: hypothetical protein M0Z49_11000 [Chloroflexi bacterium]|nr:hypothetical protein [Chloroflexota bacterium]MDA8237041.1 hypothetical protein [Chloroflexota bacterium]
MTAKAIAAAVDRVAETYPAEIDRARAALDPQRVAIDALPAALLREVFGEVSAASVKLPGADETADKRRSAMGVDARGPDSGRAADPRRMSSAAEPIPGDLT